MVNIYSWFDYFLDYILFFKRSPSLSAYLSGLFSKCSFNRIFCAFNGTLMSSPSRLFIHVLPQFGIKLIITGIDAGCDVSQVTLHAVTSNVLTVFLSSRKREVTEARGQKLERRPPEPRHVGGAAGEGPPGHRPGERRIRVLGLCSRPFCGRRQPLGFDWRGGMSRSVTGLIPVQSLLPCGRSGYCFSSS